MRTRADVIAELVEAHMKKPNSWSSSMARMGRIPQLKKELNALDAELYTQQSEPEEPKPIIINEKRKIEFVINGYKVTLEPQH